MTEYVNLSVLIGISGAFLTDPARFSKISDLFAELSQGESRLTRVKAQLDNCNHPLWLNSFGRRCERRKRDPRLELPSLVSGLEAEKKQLELRITDVRRDLAQLEPTAVNVTTALAEPVSGFSTSPVKRRVQNPDMAARNALIDSLLEESDLAICKALDFDLARPDGRPTMGLPQSWVSAFNVHTFCAAYSRCPKLVHTLISKRRRLALSP
jgi:hypothetical protein